MEPIKVLTANVDKPNSNTIDVYLEGGGYEVIEASNGKDGLEKSQSAGFAIDLVVTDIEMPEMNGAELVERLKARCPDVRILYMSGYTEDKMMREKLIQPGAPFLEKPFTPAILLEKAREVLRGDLVA